MNTRKKINITFAIVIVAIVLITFFVPWLFAVIGVLALLGAFTYFAATVIYSIIEALFDDD